MGGLAGDAERVRDFSPGRTSVQGAGSEAVEVGLGGMHDTDLLAGAVECVDLAALVLIDVCQGGLTGTMLSGRADGRVLRA